MAVCGPSGCGKTKIIFQMLLKNTIFPNFKSIYYFYQHDQPKFQTVERNLNIYFTKFSEFEFISQLENCLLVFDDSCESMTRSFQNLQQLDATKNQCYLC